MVIPKINSTHGSDTRNIINRAIDLINTQGKSIQDLVAKGQLTPTQYATLIQTVNGLISKGDVSVLDIDKNKGKFDSTYFSSDFLKDLNDGVINATELLPESVTEAELVDKAVTPNKTSFIHVSRNLIDENQSDLNRRVTADGTEADSSNNLSSFIRIDPNTQYSFFGVDSLAYYDASKKFITFSTVYSLDNPVQKMTPFNVYYMKVNYYTQSSGKVIVNKGSTIIPYEKFYRRLVNVDIDGGQALENNSIGGSKLKDDSIGVEKTSFINTSSNLFNPDEQLSGYSILSTGVLQKDSRYDAIFIENVNSGEVYTVQPFDRVVFFREDGSLLSLREQAIKDEGFTFSVPDGTHKIGLHKNRVREEKPQINKGSKLLPYEDFYVSILGQRLNGSENEFPEVNNDDLLNRKVIYPSGNLDGEVILKDDVYLGIYDGIDVATLYQKYETLKSSHSDYFTSKVIGKDTTGEYNIYEYTLKEKEYNGSLHGEGGTGRLINKKPKVIFLANIHGHEQISALAPYYMTKALCEDWSDNPILEYLRHNVEFKFIPILYPNGYDTDMYSNVTGVNLQTNFPYNFTERDQSSSAYGGSEPLTEIETVYAKNFIDQNKDAVLFMDLHSAGYQKDFAETIDSLFYFIIARNDGYNAEMDLITKTAVEKNTRMLKKKYGIETNKFLGWVSMRDGNGTADAYAGSLDIPSMVVELQRQLPGDPNGYTSDGIKSGTEVLINNIAITLNHFKDNQ